MNSYVTGSMIKKLREERNLTQSKLADIIGVSDKAVSKWETGKGLPDITLLENLAVALKVSVAELLSGETVTNGNRSFNMKRIKFYVCPVCGNVITGTGEAVVSCHGITLPPLEPEVQDEKHIISTQIIEDEYYVTVEHEMSKEHYISFIAALCDNELRLTKLYPEGNAEARFKRNRVEKLYAYCNKHGLFRIDV